MKVSLELVNSTYDWDADSTDLDETELSDSPNRIYQETASAKMENSSLKQKGGIKWNEKEDFLRDISIRMWKDKKLKSVNLSNTKMQDSMSLCPYKKLQKEKSLRLPSEYLSAPMCSFKSNSNSVAEDIKCLLRELVKIKQTPEKPKESRMQKFETIHDVLPSSG